jgi:hypothetical protein
MPLSHSRFPRLLSRHSVGRAVSPLSETGNFPIYFGNLGFIGAEIIIYRTHRDMS